MKLVLSLCLLYFLLSYAFAASTTPKKHDPDPTTSPPKATSTSGLHASAITLSTPLRTQFPAHTTHHSSIFKPHPTIPPPANTPTHPPYHSSPPGIKPIAIVGIVIGALAGIGVLFGIARCWWNWRKTPSQDRITTLMHRYHLQREMEEAAAEPIWASVPRPPPPPYRPPPPGYDTLLPSSPPQAHTTSLVADWDQEEH